MERIPNPKAAPGLVKILQDIHKGLEGPPRMSRRTFYQKVVAELQYEAPAYSTFVQHLRYWDKCFRKPSPLCLGVYYWIACRSKLRENVLLDAYEFPSEGRIPLALRPLKVTTID